MNSREFLHLKTTLPLCKSEKNISNQHKSPPTHTHFVLLLVKTSPAGSLCNITHVQVIQHNTKVYCPSYSVTDIISYATSHVTVHMHMCCICYATSHQCNYTHAVVHALSTFYICCMCSDATLYVVSTVLIQAAVLTGLLLNIMQTQTKKIL